jgi:tetratricopeptide (TPR) repeat protein
VAQDPTDANAHMGLGMAFAGQNNHEAAINEFQTTLRLAPHAEDVYYRMGVSQVQLKQYDNAIASYLKERDRSGDDAELESALADAYQAKGMQQQAQDARNKAAQLEDARRD